MSYSASCHCGAVSADVAEDLPARGMVCNCSICRRKGTVLHFTPAGNVRIQAADDAIGSYQFNRHVIEHKFCRVCGCSPFARGSTPDGGEMVAVNLRCVPECDLDALEIDRVDGASF